MNRGGSGKITYHVGLYTLERTHFFSRVFEQRVIGIESVTY